MALQMNHDPVAGWIPIVRSLLDRGVDDVPVLVFTLAYREFELEAGKRVQPWERLMRAMPTVAAALDRPLADVQQEVVARAANPVTEPELRAKCYVIAEQLDGLPGVKSVGMLEFGAHPLPPQFRRLAIARNIPLPKLAEASAEWLEVLRSLKAHGTTDELVFSVGAGFHAVTLSSGQRFGPIGGDTMHETLAELSGTTAAQTEKRVEQAIIMRLNEFQSLKAKAKELLQVLPEVERVEEAAPPPPRKLQTPRYDGPPVAPPWTVFPEPPDSMRWRMGPGQDHMTRWWWFFDQLPKAERAEYFAKNPAPPEWNHWVQRVLTRSKS